MMLFMPMLVGTHEVLLIWRKKIEKKRLITLQRVNNTSDVCFTEEQADRIPWDFQCNKSSIKKGTTTDCSYHCQEMDMLKRDYQFSSEILLSRTHQMLQATASCELLHNYQNTFQCCVVQFSQSHCGSPHPLKTQLRYWRHSTHRVTC